MPTVTDRFHKRTAVELALEKAGKALRQAQDIDTALGKTLEALGKALAALKEAGGLAEPHRLEVQGKTKRDGLPGPIQRAIAAEAVRVQALAARVKATPVTPGEKALAKHDRLRRKGHVSTPR